MRALEEMGYRVRPGESLSAPPDDWRAGPAGRRARELEEAFADPEIRAVWCVRGGYGATELLPLLDYGCISAHPKPLIGYSDITALHLAVQRRCRMVTFHGPMAADLAAADPDTREKLAHALAWTGERTRWTLPSGWHPETLAPGRASGRLVGGNLSLVAALAGTPWAAQAAGSILLLEEVNEPPQRLARLLFQLAASGILTRAAGILLGQFTRCDGAHGDAHTLLTEYFSGWPQPVLAGLPVGHGRPNGTLPLGAWCTFDAQTGELWLEARTDVPCAPMPIVSDR